MNFKKLRLGKLSFFALVFTVVALAGAFLAWRGAGPSASAASDCRLNVTASGNVSVAPVSGNNCSISNDTIEGVDGGDLTIPTGRTVTIEPGAQLVINPGKQIFMTNEDTQIILGKSGGRSGAIVKGYLCAVDSDGDGYADKVGNSSEPVYQYSSSPTCPALTVRKANIVNIAQLDCVAGAGQKVNATCSPKLGSWERVGSCGEYEPGIQYMKMDWTRTTLTPAGCGGNDCVASGTDYDYTLDCECNPNDTKYISCGDGNCARTSELLVCDSSGHWPTNISCTPGTPGTCASLGYDCGNNMDDGCGGTIDCGDDNGSQSCSVGVGGCVRTGTQWKTCSSGSWSVWGACSATPGTPGTESCNGVDDDCDGSTDEEITPLTQSCTVGYGICQRTGTQTKTCSDGSWSAWSACSATAGTPTAEICNGLNDDCDQDGSVDEGLTAPSQSCTAGTGDCERTGTQVKTCNGASGWSAWGACSATAGTPTKTCANQGDKNCDYISDGCGSSIYCGACTAPDTCGGTGIANVCGKACTSGYIDLDGDGYGNPAQYNCWGSETPSSNISSNGYDCEDSNSLITTYGQKNHTPPTCDPNAYCEGLYTQDICQNGDWNEGTCAYLIPRTSQWCTDNNKCGNVAACHDLCSTSTMPCTAFTKYNMPPHWIDCGSSTSYSCDSNGDGMSCGTVSCVPDWPGFANGGTWSSCTGDTVQVYYVDRDGDGYGNPDEMTYACPGNPPGYLAYVTNNYDCNDNDDSIGNSYSTGGWCYAGVGACMRQGSQGQTCTNGVWGALSACSATTGTPTTETCNGIDDDCDGSTDEGLNYSQSCSVGTGACYRTGTQSVNCSGGSWSYGSCSASAGSPSSESCNGVDDDCDGSTDEGLSQSQSCTVGVGLCANSGTQSRSCSGGSWSGWSSCSATAFSPPPCAYFGYVCGSSVSNGCGGYMNCGANSESTSCSVGTGACYRTGTKTRSCSGGSWGSYGACSATAGSPGTESCNGVDDDCDGSTDEGTNYNQSCTNGQSGSCYRTGTYYMACNNGSYIQTTSCNAPYVAPGTCSSLGYSCGSSMSNGCGGYINCGANSRTRSCTVGGSPGYYYDTCSGGSWSNGTTCYKS
ncbi:MAG: MopE-related protein [Patescibacteria group bacterium]